jgi:hypothetical protein
MLPQKIVLRPAEIQTELQNFHLGDMYIYEYDARPTDEFHINVVRLYFLTATSMKMAVF